MVSVRGNQTNNKVTASASTSTNNRAEVKPVNINNQVEATNNLAKYYSEISQDWAVGEGLIQGIDYSSKTYALQAKESANEAKESMEITEEYMDNAISNIQTAETNALSNIVMQEESALSTVNQGIEQLNTTITEGVETIETLQANSVAEITTNKESALSDITTASNLGLNNITTAETNALNNIDTDLNNATSEINTNRANTLAQISTLANESISDINATAKSYDTLTHKNITNCLLEVPQRIKFELKDGNFILKAGSQFIIPNGFENDGITPRFDYHTISKDIMYASINFTNTNYFVYNVTTGWIDYMNVTYSGAEHHSSDYGLSYNTTTNNVKIYSAPNTVYADKVSFPFAKLTSDGTTITVDQVFNGIGYIGSTVWRDKGVRSLAVNGKNEDGTYNNIEHISNDIYLHTIPTTDTGECYIGLIEGKLTHLFIGAWNYNEKLNSIEVAGTQAYDVTFAGTFTSSAGVISNFNPKQPFRAVGYSDKPEISGWGMPSSKDINLTVGASGATYTAPANGWFSVNFQAAAANGFIALYSGISNTATANSGRYTLTASIAVKKNAVITVYYGNGNVTAFRFIYAQGSESEAS